MLKLSIDQVIPCSVISSIVLFLLLSQEGFSAPVPGGGGFFLEDLFLDAPLLGLGLGAAGGAVATGLAGLAAANTIATKVNSLANVANAKINLLNLGANLVGAGSNFIEGAGIILIRKSR